MLLWKMKNMRKKSGSEKKKKFHKNPFILIDVPVTNVWWQKQLLCDLEERPEFKIADVQNVVHPKGVFIHVKDVIGIFAQAAWENLMNIHLSK
mmetsp:Transcript_2845/g.3966  ORF Transcript_2845/g.3966 Transcript_2845/m.3966 type:complete len:93 (+) Transcript_2845:284-562(+)